MRMSLYSLYVAVEMTRYTVHYDRGHITLDEGAHIADKFICNVGPVLGHPFTRNKFLVVCNLVYIFYFCAALIRVIGNTFEYYHLSGITFICSLYCCSSDLGSFQDVHAGRTVGGRAL